jgi:hypothetical protein
VSVPVLKDDGQDDVVGPLMELFQKGPFGQLIEGPHGADESSHLGVIHPFLAEIQIIQFQRAEIDAFADNERILHITLPVAIEALPPLLVALAQGLIEYDAGGYGNV